jgi:hypothetical protein
VSLSLRCNEDEAELTLRYAEPGMNPLSALPKLPVDNAHFTSTPDLGSTITLRKSLA